MCPPARGQSVRFEAFRSVWKVEDAADGDVEKLALPKGWISGNR